MAKFNTVVEFTFKLCTNELGEYGGKLQEVNSNNETTSSIWYKEVKSKLLAAVTTGHM
jgi:hypothetical protein